MTSFDLITLLFLTLIGACVGSFLNVVIYRMPAGLSIVRPRSRCPQCKYELAWYDNIPVLSWLILRGRCRRCGSPISLQYPVIEAITAAMFGGWYAIAYLSPLRPDFAGPGVGATWPVTAVYLMLFAGLLAALMIDARHYVVPLGITWLIALAAMAVYPTVALIYPQIIVSVKLPDALLWPAARLGVIEPPYEHAAGVRLAIEHAQSGAAIVSAVPWVGGRWVAGSFGGGVGLLVAVFGLIAGILPRSFPPQRVSDNQPHTNALPADSPEAFLAYPHPRREVLKELLFLALPVGGAAVGYFVFDDLMDPGPWVLKAPAGALAGYLVGGGIVWITRVLGTLAFGKEAMGLGDAHLLAMVGAVCGWEPAVIAFFVAPFLGLSWAILTAGAQKLLKRQVRIIPYGPHLAVASLIVIVFREPMVFRLGMLFGG